MSLGFLKALLECIRAWELFDPELYKCHWEQKVSPALSLLLYTARESAFCGLVGLFFPHIIFTGYEIYLNEVLDRLRVLSAMGESCKMTCGTARSLLLSELPIKQESLRVVIHSALLL